MHKHSDFEWAGLIGNNGEHEWECILSVKGYDDYYGYTTKKSSSKRSSL